MINMYTLCIYICNTIPYYSDCPATLPTSNVLITAFPAARNGRENTSSFRWRNKTSGALFFNGKLKAIVKQYLNNYSI